MYLYLQNILYKIQALQGKNPDLIDPACCKNLYSTHTMEWHSKRRPGIEDDTFSALVLVWKP